jgi:uncharacterized protein
VAQAGGFYERLKTPKLWTRRDVLKLTAASSTLIGLGCLSYGAMVREHVEISRVDVSIVDLPDAFAGFTIAHMSDIHHGIYTSLDYINRCVEIVNGLKPDLVALTGDFTFGGGRYLEPCAEAFRSLKSRAGVYAVLGNHDYYLGAGLVARAFRRAGVDLMIDQKERLEHRGDKLWVLGVDDLYYGETRLPHVMREIPRGETRIVLAHEPDYIEEFAEKGEHADLLMCGHTHGGQIRFPLIGAPQVPSAYGQRYAMGLARKGAMQIYTTRGVGSILLPVRFDCPPEIALYTLRGSRR